MQIVRTLFASLCLATLSLTACRATAASAPVASLGSPFRVTPLPNHIVTTKGHFTLPAKGGTFCIKGITTAGLCTYLQHSPLQLAPTTRLATAHIAITISGSSKKTQGTTADESYRLTVTPKQIRIQAATEAGAFYAIQTLLQMTDEQTGTIQCCTIQDQPAFRYRGLLFDVSRHFRPKQFLLKQMDAMALLKLNRMHLHLTDGAGWRIEIDRYPRLTELAAWRPARTWTEWTEKGKRYCDKNSANAYGGYYTKQDIRDILAYARERHITVIPEIEMPGHSEEVLTAYPELSCSGQPYKNDDFCAGKEATFTFLENVLDEVIQLFPSEYIHIGGDEAAKNGWRTCPDCQKRMQSEHLKDVDQLQSYFIHRIEKYINRKGRKLIGYDEILEGGLAPNATVMSWRGTEGGLKALRARHDVIMTPGEYCYLDYTQDAPYKEPPSIGGYTPLKTVYSYNPAQGLTPEEAGHLLGIQSNLWSEYIPEDDHAEYMYYPRAFAIAETGWTQAANKNYDSFRPRAVELCQLLTNKGYHPFDLSHEYGERRESLTPANHLAKGCKVTYNVPLYGKWKAHGDTTLTDGVLGGWSYTDRKWQGTMKDFDVTIDLGAVKDIHYIGATFMHSAGAWVYVPQKVDFYVSTNGSDFQLVGTAWNDLPDSYERLLFKQFSTLYTGQARYVRLHAKKNNRDGAWLFTDEVIVN